MRCAKLIKLTNYYAFIWEAYEYKTLVVRIPKGMIHSLTDLGDCNF